MLMEILSIPSQDPLATLHIMRTTASVLKVSAELSTKYSGEVLKVIHNLLFAANIAVEGSQNLSTGYSSVAAAHESSMMHCGLIIVIMLDYHPNLSQD